MLNEIFVLTGEFALERQNRCVDALHFQALVESQVGHLWTRISSCHTYYIAKKSRKAKCH